MIHIKANAARFVIYRAFLLVVSIITISCESPTKTSGNSSTPIQSTGSYVELPEADAHTIKGFSGLPVFRQKLSFSGEYKDVSIDGLTGNDVFIVKTNLNNEKAFADTTGRAVVLAGSISAMEKNSVKAYSRSYNDVDPFTVSNVWQDENGEIYYRVENPEVQEWNANPMPWHEPAMKRTRGVIDGTPLANTYSVGETRQFWVETGSKVFVEIPATLRATGEHCDVWIAADNYGTSSGKNKVTTNQAQTIAEKFSNIIYEKETNLFGFEYGADVDQNSPIYGGVDGNIKIQILIYDIDFDFRSDQIGGTYGYFWNKDEYSQENINAQGLAYLKSNLAEIFYLDAHLFNFKPNMTYSSLAHEFQHMINFNQKIIKRGKPSSTWYNEMLSMLAEDAIDSYLGIKLNDDGNPVRVRIPQFLCSYNYADPMVWLKGDDVYKSYGNSYGLGAYLVRNFGGAALLKAMVESDSTDEASINTALSSDANPLNETINSFNSALTRFGETFLFTNTDISTDAMMSFNKTVATTINDIPYVFKGFDIWTYNNRRNGRSGPLVWKAENAYEMAAKTTLVQYIGKLSGDVTVRVYAPTVSNITIWLYAR